MIIYKVTNLVNGKVYIGKTSRKFEQRKSQHIRKAFNSNSNLAFHRALRKYGEDNFTWEVIDSAETEEEILEKEIIWIAYYNTYTHNKNSNGYNMTLGGDGASGFKQNEESVQKRLDTMKRNDSIQRGTKNHNSKLTEDDVLQIKKLIKTGITISKIAIKFNVEPETVSGIKRGKSWVHIGEDVSNVECDGRAKLTENEVREIKSLIKEGKIFYKEISEMFGVDATTISDIKKGKTWVDVGEDLSNIECSKIKNSKLTEDDVKEIKLLLKEGNLKQKEIASKFNVKEAAISEIKQNKSWAHIGEDLSNVGRGKKLTEDNVRGIKMLLKEGKLTQTKIAEMYDVAISNITFIKKGKIWGHIEIM